MRAEKLCASSQVQRIGFAELCEAACLRAEELSGPKGTQLLLHIPDTYYLLQDVAVKRLPGMTEQQRMQFVRVGGKYTECTLSCCMK